MAVIIEHAEKEDELRIKDLWEIGFGETKEFLDFYFRERYKQEGTFVARESEQVVASLQTLPTMLHHRGRNLLSAYILGVVTHPGHRKLGYAGSLMKAALLEQSQKGILVSTLIPAQPYLFDVYQKYGFTEIFSIQEQEILLNDLKLKVSKNEYTIGRYDRGNLCFSTGEMERFYEFYTQAYKHVTCSLLKSKEDFLFCIKEFLLFEGDIYTAVQKNQIVACAFLAGGERNRFVKELLFTDENSKNFLLHEISRESKQDTIIVKAPPENNSGVSSKPLGMARVTQVYGVLQALAKEKAFSLCVKVTDPVIQENNNVFQVKNDKIKIGKANDIVDLSLTIQEFTRLALGYGLDIEGYLSGRLPFVAYMNLMLND